MISALYSVNGSSDQVAHSVSFNTDVALAIVNTAGIDYAQWDIVGQSHTATTATITPGVKGLTATLRFPVDPGVDWAIRLRCKVNGGAVNGVVDNNLIAYMVIGTMAHGPSVPFVANEGFDRNPVAGWCEALNSKTSLATPSTAGLMSASQVATLNTAVLAAAHGHTTVATTLGYDGVTIVVPSINITGMAVSSRYNLVVGARVTVHQTGTPANYGFIDVVAYGYVISGTGGAGSELRIASSTADSSKLSSALAATTAAIVDKTSSDFEITVTRPTGVSIVVDAVEYWIATLEKLTL